MMDVLEKLLDTLTDMNWQYVVGGVVGVLVLGWISSKD